MACATLKRSLEFDAMYNVQGRPNKRARYGSKQISPTGSSDSGLTPKQLSPAEQSGFSPFSQVANKMTPEKMAANIKEEAHRLNRRKQLKFSPQRDQTMIDPNDLMDKWSSCDKDKVEDQKPLFTYSQVAMICERMMKEQEEKIREEYDKVLSAKLAEQYDTFIKFTHDQIHKKFKTQDHPSYLS